MFRAGLEEHCCNNSSTRPFLTDSGTQGHGAPRCGCQTRSISTATAVGSTDPRLPAHRWCQRWVRGEQKFNW